MKSSLPLGGLLSFFLLFLRPLIMPFQTIRSQYLFTICLKVQWHGQPIITSSATCSQCTNEEGDGRENLSICVGHTNVIQSRCCIAILIVVGSVEYAEKKKRGMLFMRLSRHPQNWLITRWTRIQNVEHNESTIIWHKLKSHLTRAKETDFRFSNSQLFWLRPKWLTCKKSAIKSASFR